jgi:hypothetical protein
MRVPVTQPIGADDAQLRYRERRPGKPLLSLLSLTRTEH